ncbi:Trp biosynthesis-associated membrane protein [Microcella sp.]|uniref:Trp biosynthesis-associated membrane protein n=1 Tax=Microcella sp. TaxID=1913979 RepID=UPI00299F5837|nr:Trp biosynthesis-associated membrane protein [Microcella sp.]MDX2025194.1 Trp biosynthesis-associated membrane protein [Microcella sp.]
MTAARRVRLLALMSPIVVAAVAMLAWTQPWVELQLTDGRTVIAAGDATAPAVPPFALAGLALVGALTLAGLVFRIILGLLQSLLGVGLIASGMLAVSDPVAASLAPLTAATGVDGLDSVRALVESTSVSAWPWVAIVAGGAAVVVGIAIAATASRWPQRTRRFDGVKFAAEPTDARTDRLDAWDALSDGDDPTAR